LLFNCARTVVVANIIEIASTGKIREIVRLQTLIDQRKPKRVT